MVPSRGSPAVSTCASLSVSTSAASAAETISIETLFLKIQLRWAGRISRLEDHRLPKMALCKQLATGHCGVENWPLTTVTQGHQWRGIETLEKVPHHLSHLPPQPIVRSGDVTVQDTRKVSTEEKGTKRKTREPSASTPDQTFTRSRSGRACLPSIGLVIQSPAYLQQTSTSPFLSLRPPSQTTEAHEACRGKYLHKFCAFRPTHVLASVPYTAWSTAKEV